MGLGLLIEDSGHIGPAETCSLRHQFHARLEAAEFVSYAVRNLGFVQVVDYGESVRVALKPRTVHPVALGCLVQWFGEARPRRVLVSYIESQERYVMLPGLEKAIDDISRTVGRQQGRKQGKHRRSRVAIETLEPESPFRSLLGIWQDSRRLDYARVRPMLEQLFSGRFILVGKREPTGDLEVLDIGRGFTVLDRHWLRLAIGRHIYEQPDYDFGRWAADAYLDAARAGEPVIEDIEALIAQPRQPARTACYRRMILPFEGPNGEPLLLGATLMGDGDGPRLERRREA